MEASKKFPVLIAGGSGRMGRMLVQEVLNRGVNPTDVIVTTRTPDKLADFAALGVDVRHADFVKRPQDIAKAFAGARRCFLISIIKRYPKPGEQIVKPGTRELVDDVSEKAEMRAAIAGAKAAGVEHVFYTSAPNVEPENPVMWADEHYSIEQSIKQSGMTWTILRNARQPDIFLTTVWRFGLEAGVLPDGNAGGKAAWITREDTVAADAGVLLAPTDEIANRSIDLTGPAAVTTEEVMAILGRLAGKEVRVERVDVEDVANRMIALGAPPLMAPGYTMWAQSIRGGFFGTVTSDSERFAGRPLTTIAQYLERMFPQLPGIVQAYKERLEHYSGEKQETMVVKS